MMRTKLFSLGILAVALASLEVPHVTANEAKKDTGKTAAPSKEVICIYAGNCSRSMQLHGKYTTIEAAHRAAKELRAKQMRRVELVVSSREIPYLNWKVTEYRIYRIGCKGTAQQTATASTAAKVKELTESIEKQGDKVEIVAVAVAH